jgi:hypothetical protein
MGGCAYHAFEESQHENRCSTFRHTYLDQICHNIDVAEGRDNFGSATGRTNCPRDRLSLMAWRHEMPQRRCRFSASFVGGRV